MLHPELDCCNDCQPPRLPELQPRRRSKKQRSVTLPTFVVTASTEKNASKIVAFLTRLHHMSQKKKQDSGQSTKGPESGSVYQHLKPEHHEMCVPVVERAKRQTSNSGNFSSVASNVSIQFHQNVSPWVRNTFVFHQVVVRKGRGKISEKHGHPSHFGEFNSANKKVITSEERPFRRR